MKPLFILALLCLCASISNAQTIEVDILDANLSVMSNTGTVKVYVSDQSGIASIQVSVGSQPDSTDVYTNNLTLGSAGTFYSQGTVQDGIITLPLGALSSQDDYYTRVTLTLTDATTRTIDVHTAN